MNELSLFLPIHKIDAVQRLVYGVATAEQPDRSGEICDYGTTKPHYEKWSSDIAKTTQGKSFGNVRAMHGKVAAGKVTDIKFNDPAKQIEIIAKIVDDDEWRKVTEGVYSGFSQGGAYEKRWQDPTDEKLMRYTARPSEVSLVDLPCLPGAVFQMVKADGVVEEVPFKAAVAAEDASETVEKAVEGHSEDRATRVADKALTPVNGPEWEQVWQSKRDGKTFHTKSELARYHEELDAAGVADAAAKPAMKAIADLGAVLHPTESDAVVSAPADVVEKLPSEEDLGKGDVDGQSAESPAPPDVEKTDEAEAEKMGARHNSADHARLIEIRDIADALAQSNATVAAARVRDHALAMLGTFNQSEDPSGLEKAAADSYVLKSDLDKVKAENAAMIAKFDMVTAEVRKLAEMPMPMPFGGKSRVVSKSEDGGRDDQPVAVDEAGIRKLMETKDGQDKLAIQLFKLSQQNGVALSLAR